MAGRGGKQPGAGRPKGSRTKEKAMRAHAIELAGIEPKDFLLKGLAIHNRMLEDEMAKPETERNQENVRTALAAGREFAKDVAPYIHHRLNAIEANVKGTLTLEALVMESVKDRGGK